MGHFIPGMESGKLLFTQIVARPAGGDDGLEESFVEAVQAVAATGMAVRLETDNCGVYVIDRQSLVNLKDDCCVGQLGKRQVVSVPKPVKSEDYLPIS
jgi:hypothetical protein